MKGTFIEIGGTLDCGLQLDVRITISERRLDGQLSAQERTEVAMKLRELAARYEDPAITEALRVAAEQAHARENTGCARIGCLNAANRTIGLVSGRDRVDALTNGKPENIYVCEEHLQGAIEHYTKEIKAENPGAQVDVFTTADKGTWS